jgi:hypothetical protein
LSCVGGFLGRPPPPKNTPKSSYPEFTLNT